MQEHVDKQCLLICLHHLHGSFGGAGVGEIPDRLFVPDGSVKNPVILGAGEGARLDPDPFRAADDVDLKMMPLSINRRLSVNSAWVVFGLIVRPSVLGCITGMQNRCGHVIACHELSGAAYDALTERVS